jgi:hypothetical protein
MSGRATPETGLTTDTLGSKLDTGPVGRTSPAILSLFRGDREPGSNGVNQE